MVHQILIVYPHGVIVIGKSTVKDRTDDQLRAGTTNAFQLWLNKNYIENDEINCGIALLNMPYDKWKAKAPRCGVYKTYEECLDSLELFKGKVIEVIVGM
jgi:hypothetical protein